ncbi:MAG: sporulation protein YqfD [Bacilli bacterium]|nr:sporulation protein YqfD [Bacilli bacterium]
MFFDNIVKLKITGKNIKNFIKRINSLSIDMLEIIYINYNEAYIKIKKIDYEKIQNLKTIYEIEIIQIYGIDKIKYNLKKNNYIIISLLIGMIIIYILSNMIFNIEIIHNDSDLRKIIKEELNNNNIKIGQFKKNYQQIQIIKKNILNKYKNKIEWLEIEEVGTKYIIRLEERIITKQEENKSPQNVVAKKDAIILRIYAKNGEIVKNINDYVKKGETVISGEIKLNEEIKKTVPAKGEIYGEIWYKVNIEYPLYYYEIKEINKAKTTLVINILNNKIKLFNNKKTKTIKTKKLFKNSLLPITISLNKEKEIKIINEQLNEQQAIKKAEKAIYDKINKNLKNKEKILSYKIIKKEIKNKSIILEMFVVVCENITDYEQIIIDDETVEK